MDHYKSRLNGSEIRHTVDLNHYSLRTPLRQIVFRFG